MRMALIGVLVALAAAAPARADLVLQREPGTARSAVLDRAGVEPAGAVQGLPRVEVVVVTGYAAERIAERQGDLEARHGVALELVFNPKAEEWNNAYSLWCAREHFARGSRSTTSRRSVRRR